MIKATAIRPGSVVSRWEAILVWISSGSPSFPRNGSLKFLKFSVVSPDTSKDLFEARPPILASANLRGPSVGTPFVDFQMRESVWQFGGNWDD